MSSEERSSIANGIWLCQTCAHKIDVDPAEFPPELLHNWNRQAEQEASSLLGKPAQALVPASTFSMFADHLARSASVIKKMSELTRDQALAALEGLGAIFPTGDKPPDEVVKQGTFSLCYRGGAEVSQVMLIDIPGGVLDNRVSVIRNDDHTFTLRVLDAMCEAVEATSIPAAHEQVILVAVAWTPDTVTMWVDEDHVSVRLRCPLTHLGPKILVGIDIGGALSADNIRPGYICGNIESLFNIERNGIWRGTFVDNAMLFGIAHNESELLKLARETRAFYEEHEASHHETLARFLDVVAVVDQDGASWLVIGTALRNLLVTGYPYLSDVAEAVRQLSGEPCETLFHVAHPSDELMAWYDGSVLFTLQDGLDPETALTKGKRMHVPTQDLLELRVLKVEDRWYSVADYLELVGVLHESAPRGLPIPEEHRQMLLASTFQVGGVDPIARQVQALRRVFLRGVEPLVERAVELLREAGWEFLDEDEPHDGGAC